MWFLDTVNKETSNTNSLFKPIGTSTTTTTPSGGFFKPVVDFLSSDDDKKYQEFMTQQQAEDSVYPQNFQQPSPTYWQLWQQMSSLAKEKWLFTPTTMFKDNDFLKEYKSPQEEVANSWIFRNQPNENIMNIDLKQKASGSLGITQKILDYTKSMFTDPNKQTEIDAMWNQVKNVIAESQAKAFDTYNLSEWKRKLYWYAADVIQNLMNDPAEWYIWKAKNTKDTWVLNEWLTVAQKIYQITNDVLTNTNDNELLTKEWEYNVRKKIEDRIKEETQYESKQWDESIDTKLDQAKYENLNWDWIWWALKKWYYGLSVWMQMWKEQATYWDETGLQKVIWPLWKLIDPISDAVWAVKKVYDAWYSNPLTYLWAVAWSLFWKAWYVANLISPYLDIKWEAYDNRYANMMASRARADELSNTQWLTGNILWWAKNIALNFYWNIMQDADDRWTAIATLPVWWALSKITNLKKIWYISDMASKSKLINAAVWWFGSVMDWILTNAAVNTMWWQEYNNKRAWLDLWLDFWLWALWWLWKTAYKTFTDWKYWDFLKTVDWHIKNWLSEADALERSKEMYLVKAWWDADLFDNVVADMKKKNIDFNKAMWQLKDDAFDKHVVRTFVNSKDQQEIFREGIKARITKDIWEAATLEDAQNIAKAWFWLKYDKLNQGIDTTYVNSTVFWKESDKIKLDKLKNMYVSTSTQLPDIMRQIDSAKTKEEVANIIYKHTWWEGVADFYLAKAKTDVFSKQLAQVTDKILHWTDEEKQMNSLFLNDMFRNFWLTDISIKNLNRNTEWFMANVRHTVSDIFQNDIIPQIKDPVVKKNLLEQVEKMKVSQDEVAKWVKEVSKEWEDIISTESKAYYEKDASLINNMTPSERKVYDMLDDEKKQIMLDAKKKAQIENVPDKLAEDLEEVISDSVWKSDLGEDVMIHILEKYPENADFLGSVYLASKNNDVERVTSLINSKYNTNFSVEKVNDLLQWWDNLVWDLSDDILKDDDLYDIIANKNIEWKSPELLSKAKQMNDIFESIANIQAMNLVWNNSLEKYINVTQWYKDNIINRIIQDKIWFPDDLPTGTKEINSLMSKFSWEFLDSIYKENKWTVTKQRLLLWWHKAFWNRGVRLQELSTVMSSYKDYIAEIGKTRLFDKAWKEIVDTSEKFDILASNWFNVWLLNNNWYILWKWQNVANIQSLMQGMIMNFDWTQKEFSNYLLTEYNKWYKNFTESEVNTLRKTLSVLDRARYDYNKLIIDSMFSDWKLNISKLEDVLKLWSYMWDWGSLGTLYNWAWVLKRYLYWNDNMKLQFWRSFETMINKVASMKNTDLNKIATRFLDKFKKKYPDSVDFAGDMMKHYNELASNIETNYISKFRTQIEKADTTDLLWLSNKEFISHKEELIKLVMDWDISWAKTLMNKVLDEQLEDSMSKFLYNPYDYFGKPDLIADQKFFSEQYWDLWKTMWAKYPNLSSEFDMISDEVKIRYDEIFNEQFFNDIKTTQDIPLTNIDYIKNKMAWLFSYWTSNADELARITAGQMKDFNSKLWTSIWQKLLKETSDAHTKFLKDSIDNFGKKDMDAYDILDNVATDITQNINTNEAGKTVDKILWQAIKETWEELPKTQMEIWKMYSTMDNQISSLTNQYVKELMWDTYKDAMKYLKKTTFPMFQLPSVAKAMYWQILMWYNENFDTYMMWMATGEKIKTWFARFFYPLPLVQQKTEAGMVLYSRLNWISSTAKTTRMTLDSTFARSVMEMWMWKIQDWKLIMWEWKKIVEYTIWSDISAWAMNQIYKDVMNRWKKTPYNIWWWKQLTDQEIKEIAFNTKKKIDSKDFHPLFDKTNKIEFLSDFAYSFYNNFYEWLKNNFSFKKAYWSELDYKTRANYIDTNIKSKFINEMQNNTRTVKWWLDVLWTITWDKINTEIMDFYKTIWYDNTELVKNHILYEWFMDKAKYMWAINNMRNFLYTMLYNLPWALPKITQQYGSEKIKLAWYKAIYWDLWFKPWSFEKHLEDVFGWWIRWSHVTEQADTYIDRFQSDASKLFSQYAWYLKNWLWIPDDLLKKDVIRSSIAWSLDVLWVNPEALEHYWKVMNNLKVYSSIATDDALKQIIPEEFIWNESVLNIINEKVNAWNYVWNKDIQRLDELIERNYDKLPEAMRDTLSRYSSALKKDYKTTVDIQKMSKSLAKWYEASFFQVGSKITSNLAANNQLAQIIMPLFNRATKEFTTNIWDLSIDMTRIFNRYKSVADAVKSPKFYADIMTSKSMLNLAAQTMQYMVYRREATKLTQEDIDPAVWASVLIWPYAAALQVLWPIYKWWKAYKAGSNAWLWISWSIANWLNVGMQELNRWFFKEWVMLYDRFASWIQTAVWAEEKWYWSDYASIFVNTFMKKAMSAWTKWLTSSIRWYTIENQAWWNDWKQAAINTLAYSPITEKSIREKETQDLWYLTISDLASGKKSAFQVMMESLWSVATSSPDVWVMTDLYHNKEKDLWLDALTNPRAGDITRWLKWTREVLDEMTSDQNVISDKYKPWDFAKLMIDTLKWEWSDQNENLKKMSQREIKAEEQALLKHVFWEEKYDLLDANSQKNLMDRMLTYRSRFSSSYALWLVLEEQMKKSAEDLTDWVKWQATNYLKSVFGKWVLTKSKLWEEIDLRKAQIMDEMAKSNYTAAIQYNKEVWLNTRLLAAKTAWLAPAQWAETAAITLDLRQETIRSDKWYVGWMNAIKNFNSFFMKTYQDKIQATLESRPDLVTKRVTKITDNVDTSNKTDIEKAYMKAGIQLARWPKIAEALENADPELVKRYRASGTMLARDILENSNRLNMNDAVRNAWIETWLIPKPWKWKSGWAIKFPPASKLHATGSAILKAVNPEYKFKSLPEEYGTTRLPWIKSTPVWSSELETIKLKALKTKPLDVKWLETPELPVKQWRVITERMKWLKGTGGSKLYKRVIRG